jgi:circadian clock protein KaiB
LIFSKKYNLKKVVIMAKNTEKKSKVAITSEILGKEKYILRLFVAGILPNSVRAIRNIRGICNQYLKDRYELEVVDIYQQPDLALTEELIALPLLIKKFPLPEEKLLGDLSDTQKVLKGLSLV